MSCRSIIARWIECLENEVSGMDLENEKQRVFSDLACEDCAHHRWSGRKTNVATVEVLLQKLPKWVELAHCHFMRHVFFNRFPYSRQFFPRFQDPKIAEETYNLYFCPEEHRKRERWQAEFLASAEQGRAETLVASSGPKSCVSAPPY